MRIEDDHQRILGDRFGYKRRTFLGLAGSGIAIVALSACGGSAKGTGTTELTVLHFEGAGQDVVPKRVLAAYGKDKGISIKTVLGATRYSEVIAAFKANGSALINTGIFTAGVMAQGVDLGMFHKLGTSDVARAGKADPAYQAFPDYGVPFNTNLAGLIYQTDQIAAPTSWLDLLDPKYHGKVGLFDAPQGILFSGLWAVNKALDGDPQTLDKGFEAFGKAASAGQFGTLYNSNQTQHDAFARGDVVLGASVLATQANWAAAGAKIGYAVPKEGQMSVPLYLGVIKGSSGEQIKASLGLMDELLAPANLAEYNGLTSAGSVYPDVQASDAQQKLAPFRQSAIADALQVDWNSYSKNQAKFVERWNREVKGKLK